MCVCVCVCVYVCMGLILWKILYLEGVLINGNAWWKFGKSAIVPPPSKLQLGPREYKLFLLLVGFIFFMQLLQLGPQEFVLFLYLIGFMFFIQVGIFYAFFVFFSLLLFLKPIRLECGMRVFHAFSTLFLRKFFFFFLFYFFKLIVSKFRQRV